MNCKKNYVYPVSSVLDFKAEGALATSSGGGSSENTPTNPAINNEVGNGIWGANRKGPWNTSEQ